MPIVQLPNGKTAQFPDDMPLPEIEAVLAKEFPAPESGLKATARTFLREGLPFAGGLVGAALPYVATGGAAGMAGPGPGIVGAGLGAAGAKAAGQSIENFLMGTAPGERPQSFPEQARDVVQTGLASATGEVAGPVVAAGVSKALAPAAKHVTDIGRKAMQAAKDLEIPLSPDVIAPGSWLARWQTSVGQNVPVSSWIVQSQRKKTAAGILKMRNQVIEDVLGLPAAGQGQALKEAKNLAYGALDEAVGVMPGKDIKFGLPATLDFLSQNGMASLPKSKLTKDAVKKVLVEAQESGGDVSWQTIKDLRSKLWGNVGNKSVFGKLTPEEIGTRQGLADAIEADFQAIGQKVEADLPALATAAKAKYLDFKQAEKADLIEKLLVRSTRVNDDGSTMFMPSLFKQELSKASKSLDSAFQYGDAEVLTNLKKWADMMEVVGIDQGRMIMRLKQGATRPLAEAGALFGGAAAKSIPVVGGLGGGVLPVAVPVFAGFEGVVSYSMMKPNGLVKRWLTTGISHPELMRAAEKEGTKGLLMKMNEMDQEKRRR